MKFLMYSTSGEGAQILYDIQRGGNTVGLYIKDKIYKTVFDGLVQKVNNPDDFIDKDTIIIFDISGNGDIADEYKKKGHYVYGGSSFADKLEHDRAFGFDAMKNSGIKIPDYKEFTEFQQGIEYAEQSRKRLVFKPTGSMPCKLTYVPEYTEELIAYMNFVEKHFGKDIDSFVLQDFIEGCVVSSEFFCGKNSFLDPPNHTVEVKKHMNDELGPSTGCSGNITWACDFDNIIKEGVHKVEELCKKNQYIGQIDLNSVVNDDGVYGLEWTPRFGYDATPTLLSILKTEKGKFFSDIARGESNRNVDLLEEYAASIRITIPPYPAETTLDPEKFSPNKGVPILNYEDYQDELYFYEVLCGQEGYLAHSGGSGVIACALGMGNNPKQAMFRPQRIAQSLIIPDKQYRTDLDQVLPKMVREVEEYA